mgnify:CR=1 FL=1
MTNYIKADIRRILHKNTFLIAVGIFLALAKLYGISAEELLKNVENN